MRDSYYYKTFITEKGAKKQNVLFVEAFESLSIFFHAIHATLDPIEMWNREVVVYANQENLDKIEYAVFESAEWTNESTPETYKKGYQVIHTPSAVKLKLKVV
jgi:hypothetical protein